MAKSVSMSKMQSTALEGNFLDLNSESRQGTKIIELSTVKDTIEYLGALYIQAATDNLQRLNKVSSGHLETSMVAGKVQIMGTVYSLNISLADYYKFVDEGVDGWGQSHGSKYKFKKPMRGGGSKKSKFVDSLKAWLIREGKIGQIKQKHTITTREKKQQSITDTSTKAAIGAMMVIKKKGLTPTHFWTDAEKQVIPQANELLGKAIKLDIINSIMSN